MTHDLETPALIFIAHIKLTYSQEHVNTSQHMNWERELIIRWSLTKFDSFYTKHFLNPSSCDAVNLGIFLVCSARDDFIKCWCEDKCLNNNNAGNHQLMTGSHQLQHNLMKPTEITKLSLDKDCDTRVWWWWHTPTNQYFPCLLRNESLNDISWFQQDNSYMKNDMGSNCALESVVMIW